jgi:hypothetical protein
LDLLQAQQNKLLRGYQGLRSHITDFLEKNHFTAEEIRLILLLIENDGTASQTEIELAMGDIREVYLSLSEKDILKRDVDPDDEDFEYSLTNL